MAENTERLTILLQARDKDFARAMDRNNKLIAKVARDASRNTNRMSRDIDTNMSAAARSASRLGTVLGATFAGALTIGGISRFTRGIKSAVEEMSALAKQADRVGLGLGDFQGF